jgi:hypothetical protein
VSEQVAGSSGRLSSTPHACLILHVCPQGCQAVWSRPIRRPPSIQPLIQRPTHLLQVDDRNVCERVCHIRRVCTAGSFPNGQRSLVQWQCCANVAALHNGQAAGHGQSGRQDAISCLLLLIHC